MSTPSAPVISNAPLASPNTLEYWWYPPVSGAPIQDYQLTLTSQYGTLNCNVGSPGTYYRVTGLSNATTYFTTIAASNANGLGIAASFREFQPGSPPPRGVSSLSAVAVSLSTGSALVSWTPPFGYPPVPDATIFWYAIYGYTTANAVTPVVKYTAGGLTQSNYFIPGLNSNSNYYFTVRAVNCPGWSVPLSTNTITFITTLPFAPNMLNGMALWLDASDATTITLSGSNINAWTDKNISPTATTVSATKPVQVIGGLNSLNTIRFTGASSTAVSGSLGTAVGTGNLSMFAVWKPNTGTSTQAVTGVGGLAGSNGTIGMGWHSSGKYLVYEWGFNETIYSSAAGSWVVELGQKQLGQLLTTVNGNVAPTVVASANITNTTMTVGGGPGYYATGEIAETLFYNILITPFNRQKIEGYLAWKWGLQSNLPLIHPFRSARPMSNSVFAPPMLSSLQLWLDASDVSTVTLSSGRVTSWADKSGNGYNATTRINGSNIVYGTQLNGLSTLSFDRTAIQGTFTTTYTGSNLYSFAVAYYSNTASSYERILSMGLAGANDYNNTSYTNAFSRNNNTTQLVTDRNASATVSVTNTSPFLVMSYGIPGTIGIGVNGGTPTTTAATSLGYSLTNYRVAGTLGSISASDCMPGTIAELLVYTRELSTPDRQTVEGYLAWKWGLQSNLPTTHPYKYNNPAIVNFTQISPSTFGGMQLWLDASQLTGFSNGGSLTTWTDRSSNAYVGGASNGPTFITNSMNGLPIVRFNGSTQYINFGNVVNIGSAGGVATFAVVKYNNALSGGIVGKTIYGNSNGRWALTRDTSGTMKAQFFIQSEGTVSEATYSDTSTVPQLIEGLWDRQTQYIFQNGTQQASVAKASSANLSNECPLYVGAYPNGAGSAPQYYMSGDIAEVLVYTANVTPFIRQQIEGYLSWKWGLQGSLPSSHPYFISPPQQAYTTFTPTVYSGLQLWLDANDTTTVTLSSGRVTSWADKSGNGYNATTRINGSNIVYGTQLNGLSTLFFNSTAIAGVFSPPYTGSNVYSFFVGNFDTTAAGFNRVLAMGVSNQQDFTNTLYTYAFARNNNTTQIITGRNNLVATTVPGGVTTPFFATAYSIPGSQGINANGGAITSIASASTAFNLSNYVIGGPTSNTTTENFIGRMGEVLVYTRELSTDQRQTVEGYLAWKWGLQGSLPFTHPYKFMNPAINYTTSNINPNGLLVNFAAATYSGSGTWFNYGALGSTADATVENGTTSKNVAGNGVVFNGSNNYTFPNISLGNAWSASVWVKQTGSNQPSACYLTQNLGSSVINLSIFTNDSGATVGVNQVAGGFYTGTAWKIPTPYTLTSNVWVNLSYTWDGTTIISYINGTSNAAITAGASATNSGQAYRIGRRWDTASYIVGEIGQILIYNRPLSAADVAQNYAATSNIYIV